MTDLECIENLKVKVYKNLYDRSFNEKLTDDLSKLSFVNHEDSDFHTNIKGSQYNFDGNSPLKPEGVFSLERKIGDLIHSDCKIALTIALYSWVARLDKGQKTMLHDHMPQCTLAFVYFVNTPEGSSPLVFPTSGKKVEAESGTLVIFPAVLDHEVPTNNCDNRLTIAGNLTIIQT